MDLSNIHHSFEVHGHWQQAYVDVIAFNSLIEVSRCKGI